MLSMSYSNKREMQFFFFSFSSFISFVFLTSILNIFMLSLRNTHRVTKCGCLGLWKLSSARSIINLLWCWEVFFLTFLGMFLFFLSFYLFLSSSLCFNLFYNLFDAITMVSQLRSQIWNKVVFDLHGFTEE